MGRGGKGERGPTLPSQACHSQGMQPEQLVAPHTSGLVGMRTRAQLWGGDVIRGNRRGGGTTEQYAVRALKAGAAGYLTKHCLPEELVQAIRKVARGGRYASASLAEYLVVTLIEESDQPLHESLSMRS
jgi:hypothetical protein